MKTRDEIAFEIERVVRAFGNTFGGQGKFLPNNAVDKFWESIGTICNARVISSSSVVKDDICAILRRYQKQKKRSYDCACAIARQLFQMCSGPVIAKLLEKPFMANFKKTDHQNPNFLQGYYIRHAHVADFARAAADALISSIATNNVAVDIEFQIFYFLASHPNRDNDDDLANAVAADLKQVCKTA